jgi:hypothetical protein
VFVRKERRAKREGGTNGSMPGSMLHLPHHHPQQTPTPNHRSGASIRPAVCIYIDSPITPHPHHPNPQTQEGQTSIPLSVVETLPFLIALYERAILARWTLALTQQEEPHGGGSATAAAVLSSLLDSLGASVGGGGGRVRTLAATLPSRKMPMRTYP